MPSVSATICACMVRVPWPISVEPTSSRTPSSVSASPAREASLTSPPPVKPLPWKNRAMPVPRESVIVRPLLFVVRAHHERVPRERAVEHLVRCDRVLQHLAGGGDVAGAEQVLLAQLDGIEPSCAGDAIHVHLGGELRLRRAEAAERAVGRRVGHHDPAANAHGFGAVGPGGVDRRARQHDRAQR